VTQSSPGALPPDVPLPLGVREALVEPNGEQRSTVVEQPAAGEGTRPVRNQPRTRRPMSGEASSSLSEGPSATIPGQSVPVPPSTNSDRAGQTASLPGGGFSSPLSPDPLLDLDFAAIAPGAETTFDVHRVEPKVIGNRSVEGFMERRGAPFSIADLSRAHGGGVYDVVIREPGIRPRVVKGIRICGDPIDSSRSPNPYLAGVPPSEAVAVGTSYGFPGRGGSIEETVERAVDRAIASRIPPDELEDDDGDAFDHTVSSVKRMVETVGALKAAAGDPPPPATEGIAWLQSIPVPVLEKLAGSITKLFEAFAARISPPTSTTKSSDVETANGTANASVSPATVPADDSIESRIALLDPALATLAPIVKAHLEDGEPSLTETAAKWREEYPRIEEFITADVRPAVLTRALEHVRELALAANVRVDREYLTRAAGALDFFAGKLLDVTV
jgi:hypothetical protein